MWFNKPLAQLSLACEKLGFVENRISEGGEPHRLHLPRSRSAHGDSAIGDGEHSVGKQQASTRYLIPAPVAHLEHPLSG